MFAYPSSLTTYLSLVRLRLSFKLQIDGQAARVVRSWQMMVRVTKSALLIRMIDLLRNRPGITVGEMSVLLSRSERTIYRWLSLLCAELGTSLYCSNGGYYISDNHLGKRLSLSPEELLAVSLSLKSQPFGDGSPLHEFAASAWAKIREAATAEKLGKLSDLQQAHDLSIQNVSSGASPTVTVALERAVNSRRRIRAVYRSQKSNSVKEYVLDPYAMVFRKHSWYLLAYCHEHGKVSQFKLIRFVGVEETGESFTIAKNFLVDEFFSGSWEAWGGEERVTVRVQFSKRVAQMIAETTRHPTQIVEPQADGSIIYQVSVAGIDEIGAWIMGYGRDAEVLEPESLRDHIARHAADMLANYAVRSFEDQLSFVEN